MDLYKNLKEMGIDDEQIEEIVNTTDMSVYLLVYSLEKFYQVLSHAQLPEDIKKELLINFAKKENK